MNLVEPVSAAADAGVAPGLSTAPSTRPGRNCPLDYRYSPTVFASDAPADLQALDVLLVAGGLYGNEAALAAVQALFDSETGRKRLVFNGDFHWFDADCQAFDRIQRGVMKHHAIRGNVETELAREAGAGSDAAGCGCAYPADVDDVVVERSNRIIQRLRRATTAAQRLALAALPMSLRADVGGLKLAIVHGDAMSLAGWGFSQEALQSPEHRDAVRDWFTSAEVHAFACSHTCLPVFQSLRLPDALAPGWVLNNGAAGMPNFAGDSGGLVLRVSRQPYVGRGRLFGVTQSGVHIDALLLDTDAKAFGQAFAAQWPPGSDAFQSYHERIRRGPTYTVAQALRIEE